MMIQSREEDDDNIPFFTSPSIGEVIVPSHIPPLINYTRSGESMHGSDNDYSYSPSVTTSLLITPQAASPTISRTLDSQSRGATSKSNNPNVNYSSGQSSPFFRPSTPVTLTKTVTTPNGTHIMKKERKILLRSKGQTQKTDVTESKSSILGATSNLITCIVGAGIIGIPYAMNQTGIVAGLILMVVVAILTDKSLRILIETGKHADVQSYEMLMESVFGGRSGFVFISINMFFMAFGAMICYLLLIKETFASIFTSSERLMDFLILLGFSRDSLTEKVVGRGFLTISSLIVIFPLSMQRDMANLSATSTISVIFDIAMVLIVAISSPVSGSIAESGGIGKVLKESTIHISTFFIGLGVLSFAFVCQDSSFIIAGSLRKPTKRRWGIVTRLSLFICTLLGIIIGVAGYLGFQGKTKGNVLTNFLDLPSTYMLPYGLMYTYKAINVARILLGLTMFCVYPLASYVARHALIVLLFTGKSAKTGDDHSVLARWDRRFILTFVLYISALVPAIICHDVGTVLALTGAVAGSSLSYLGPGIAYLGVHGLTFIKEVKRKWNVKDAFKKYMWKFPLENIDEVDDRAKFTGWLTSIVYVIAWYSLFMPLWVTIAVKGGINFDEFEKKQMLQSPAIQKRLGKIVHRSKSHNVQIECGQTRSNSHDNYGSINRNITDYYNSSDDEEEDPQEECPPTFYDFVLAIAYIILGVVALVAGIYSLYAE